MSTKWGAIAGGLANAQDMARRRKLEDEDRAERQRQQHIQMDATAIGLRQQGILNPDEAVNRAETSDEGNNMVKLPSGKFFDPSQSPQGIARAQQDKTLRQRVSILRAHPQLQGHSDDEIVGLAQDEGSFKELVGQMFKPKEMAVAYGEDGKPYVYDKNAPTFDPNFRAKHDAKIGSQEWRDEQKAKTDAEFSPEAISGKARQAAAIAGAEEPYRKRVSAAGAVDGQTKFKADQKNKIIDDFARDTKKFDDVIAGWEVLNGALKNPSFATPFALADAYARISNPGAVVRPTTMQMIEELGSLDQRFRKFASKNINGQLPPDIVRDLVRTIGGMVREHAGTFGNTRKEAILRGQQEGVTDLEPILRNFEYVDPFAPAQSGGRGGAPLTAAQKVRAAQDPEYAKFLKDTGRTP